MPCWICIFIISAYLILIGSFALGWFKLLRSKLPKASEEACISILVPVRNEAENIPSLIRCIENQDYPLNKIELLFINDHSEDLSAELVKQNAECRNFIRLINLENNQFGKKQALQMGISVSRFDYLITTDADCIMGRNWLKSVNDYIQGFPQALLVGPVLIEDGRGFWRKFECLELLSLTASSAGAIGIGTPVMCSGANLAGSKSLFQAASTVYDSTIQSGDDIFLLQEVKRKNGPVVFVTAPEALIETTGQRSAKAYINQRSRWTFKSRYYRDRHIIITALVVLSTNLLLVVLLFKSFFSNEYFVNFALVYFLKSTVDLLLLYPFARYFKRLNWLKWFGIHQLIYIFYIAIVGISGHFSTFSWKNRVPPKV